MENKEILENLRVQIDTLDDELLNLLSRRLEIVKEVWIYKNENNIEPLQKDRWSMVLNNKIEKWNFLWLNKDFVVDIWERIHTEALIIEKNIWQ